VMCRYADLIDHEFGRNPGQKRGYCGHQEIELALIKLYHLTGDRRRLDLAAYFIDERGHQPPHYFDAEAIARRALEIAAGICVYTNDKFVLESIASK